ncbi:MAG: hypothetical protein V3R66_07120, partial [Rhodospirillales bacterium]
MTNTTPLPAWRDFSAVFPGPEPNDMDLAKPWRTGDEAAFWFSRSAWAMQAIQFWWETSRNRRQPTIWLPDYFCN